MPVVSGKKQPSLWQQMFGNEQSRFAEGIKRRREGTENNDPSDYFFDPVSSELSAPMVMMTRYAKAGIPNVARRIEATKNFLQRMKVLGPDAERASTLFAERYPRIAAHMNIEHITPELQKKFPTGSALTAIGHRSKGQFPEQTPVLFSPRGYRQGQRKVEDSLLHEGTHIAQELGNKNVMGMYHASEDALKKMGVTDWEAYKYNPFEISARTVADRKLGEKVAPYSALKGVDELVNKLPAGSAERINLAKFRRR